jgi:cell division protein FtsZ
MIDYSIIIILIPLLYLLIRGLKVTFLDIKNYLENLKYKKRIQNSKPDFSKPIKIIGVGGGGSSIVDYLVTKYPKKFSALILNSDKNALFSKSVKNKILLEKQDEYGCGSNTNCGFSLINDEVIVKLKEFINEDKNVYIFSTLGGSCGSGSIKAICQNLDIKDLEINYILTLPFNWEGSKKYNRSMETINFLREHKSIINIFKNDKLLDYGNLSMKECFNKQNEEFNLLLFPNNLES